MKPSRILAYGSIATALGVVLLLLGAATGLGTYAAPLFTGLCLTTVGRLCGTKCQLTVWVAISLLSFLLCPDLEQNLLFAFFFGWYPALRPRLQRLPRPLRLPAKLLLFNAVILAVEGLLLWLFLPEDLSAGFALVLLAAGNLCFLLYDPLIPRFAVLEQRFLARIFPHRRLP